MNVTLVKARARELSPLGFILGESDPRMFQPAVFNMSGTVLHATTGDPVKNASVKIKGTHIVTETDEHGYFSIHNLPDKVYMLEVYIRGRKQLARRVIPSHT